MMERAPKDIISSIVSFLSRNQCRKLRLLNRHWNNCLVRIPFVWNGGNGQDVLRKVWNDKVRLTKGKLASRKSQFSKTKEKMLDLIASREASLDTFREMRRSAKRVRAIDDNMKIMAQEIDQAKKEIADRDTRIQTHEKEYREFYAQSKKVKFIF